MKVYPDFKITSYEEGIKQTMSFFKEEIKQTN